MCSPKKYAFMLRIYHCLFRCSLHHAEWVTDQRWLAVNNTLGCREFRCSWQACPWTAGPSHCLFIGVPSGSMLRGQAAAGGMETEETCGWIRTSDRSVKNLVKVCGERLRV